MKRDFQVVGYGSGTGRANSCYGLSDETHLYEIDVYGNYGYPLCQRGWNRHFGLEYSIWRGGYATNCEVCALRAEKGLSGVSNQYPRKLKKKVMRSLAWCSWKPRPRGILSYTPLKPGLQLNPGGLSQTEEDENE